MKTKNIFLKTVLFTLALIVLSFVLIQATLGLKFLMLKCKPYSTYNHTFASQNTKNYLKILKDTPLFKTQDNTQDVAGNIFFTLPESYYLQIIGETTLKDGTAGYYATFNGVSGYVQKSALATEFTSTSTQPNITITLAKDAGTYLRATPEITDENIIRLLKEGTENIKFVGYTAGVLPSDGLNSNLWYYVVIELGPTTTCTGYIYSERCNLSEPFTRLNDEPVVEPTTTLTSTGDQAQKEQPEEFTLNLNATPALKWIIATLFIVPMLVIFVMLAKKPKLIYTEDENTAFAHTEIASKKRKKPKCNKFAEPSKSLAPFLNFSTLSETSEELTHNKRRSPLKFAKASECNIAPFAKQSENDAPNFTPFAVSPAQDQPKSFDDNLQNSTKNNNFSTINDTKNTIIMQNTTKNNQPHTAHDDFAHKNHTTIQDSTKIYQNPTKDHLVATKIHENLLNDYQCQPSMHCNIQNSKHNDSFFINSTKNHQTAQLPTDYMPQIVTQTNSANFNKKQLEKQDYSPHTRQGSIFSRLFKKDTSKAPPCDLENSYEENFCPKKYPLSKDLQEQISTNAQRNNYYSASDDYFEFSDELSLSSSINDHLIFSDKPTRKGKPINRKNRRFR